MLDLVFIALLQTVAGAPQTEPTDPQAERVQVTAEQPQERPRQVCRRVRETGSNMSRRVCTDGGREEQRRQDTQDALDRLGSDPAFDPSGDSPGG